MVLVIGSFMAILDGSIVNVALPKMMAIFGVGTEDIQWVMTSYMLMSGVVVPVTGYLGDRFGYKRIYIYSLVVFTVGSALCGMAWSNNSLVVARVIQAIGGGAIMPVSMSMIYRIVHRKKIGMALGIWGIAVIMAPAVGPTLGGYLVDHFDWRLIFTINIPIGVAAVILSAVVLQETSLQKGLKFDIPGAILCAAGCFAVLLALSEGQQEGWTSFYIVNLLMIGAFCLVLFFLWELYTEHPMIDVRLMYQNKVFAASLLTTSIVTIGMFSVIFLIPIYAQTLQGLTPMQTGLLMMPMALVTGFMMPISGRLFDKIGALPLCLVGLTIVVVTTYKMHDLSLDTSFRELQILLAVRASGLGLAMMPMTTAGMNTVPPMLVGRASALNNVARQIAASLGIAYLTYVMLHRQSYHAAWYADAVNWTSPVAMEAMNRVQAALTQTGLGALAGKQGAVSVLSMLAQRQAMANAIADAIVVGAVIVLTAFPLLFFLSKGKVEAERKAQMERYKHLMPGLGAGPPAGAIPGGSPAGGPGVPAPTKG